MRSQKRSGAEVTAVDELLVTEPDGEGNNLDVVLGRHRRRQISRRVGNDADHV